jgi:hypothetical protein
MFVGTARTGAILHFDLSFSRKALALTGGLADTVADNTSNARLAEQESITFGMASARSPTSSRVRAGCTCLSLEGNLYRVSQDPSSGDRCLRSWRSSMRCHGARARGGDRDDAAPILLLRPSARSERRRNVLRLDRKLLTAHSAARDST